MADNGTVVELRVHGVSGTPPDALLSRPVEFLELQAAAARLLQHDDRTRERVALLVEFQEKAVTELETKVTPAGFETDISGTPPPSGKAL